MGIPSSFHALRAAKDKKPLYPVSLFYSFPKEEVNLPSIVFAGIFPNNLAVKLVTVVSAA